MEAAGKIEIPHDLSRKSSKESICLSRMSSKDGFEGVDGDLRVSSFFYLILCFFCMSTYQETTDTERVIFMSKDRKKRLRDNRHRSSVRKGNQQRSKANLR